MKLTAPKPITFWVAVVIAVLGVIAKLVTIPVLSGYPGWLLLIAFVILALGVLIEGLERNSRGCKPVAVGRLRSSAGLQPSGEHDRGAS